MTKRDAYRAGVDSGFEAAENGDFTVLELSSYAVFIEACCDICINKVQYAGHFFEQIAQEEPEDRRDGLYEAFEKGEAVGMRKGAKKRGIK